MCEAKTRPRPEREIQCPFRGSKTDVQRMSGSGGFCCKTPIMPFDQFPANRPNEPQPPIDVALRPLPKWPVSSSLDNVVPQSIVRSPRVRPKNLYSVTQKDFC